MPSGNCQVKTIGNIVLIIKFTARSMTLLCHGLFQNYDGLRDANSRFIALKLSIISS